MTRVSPLEIKKGWKEDDVQFLQSESGGTRGVKEEKTC